MISAIKIYDCTKAVSLNDKLINVERCWVQ